MSDTIASVFWPATAQNRAARGAVIIVAGAVLLTVSAKVKVPFYPVPMTMQTFVVLALGMFCGWRLASASVASYLSLGAAGLPVFAGGGGIAYLAGPTAGFLFGFLAAAAFAGWLAQRGADRGFWRAWLALLAADAMIFFFGVLWLAQFIGFGDALGKGMLPFLLGDLSKITLAAAAVALCRRRARR